jgi:hypothetical protein
MCVSYYNKNLRLKMEEINELFNIEVDSFQKKAKVSAPLSVVRGRDRKVVYQARPYRAPACCVPPEEGVRSAKTSSKQFS